MCKNCSTVKILRICLMISNFHFSLKSTAYEELLHEGISKATTLSTNHSPCSGHFRFPTNQSAAFQDEAFVLYIEMRDAKDFATWLEVAKCFHIWDLDARGFHRGLWRMNYKGSQLFVVGVPYSDYA